MRMKRIETTIETHHVISITRAGAICSKLGWCADCAQPSRWTTPDCAAALRNVSLRTIYRWVEANSIHFNETIDGQVLLCVNSLYGVFAF